MFSVYGFQKKELLVRLELTTSSLPRKCSTAELHRHYSGLDPWAVMDSNHRRRKPAELQSAPFGHSGNCPCLFAGAKVVIILNGANFERIFCY